MRRIEAKLNLIENALEAIQSPRRTKDRTISPTAKTKEAKNLVEKIYETQRLIDLIEDPQAHYVLQDKLNSLEQLRQNLVLPMLYITCNNEEDMS